MDQIEKNLAFGLFADAPRPPTSPQSCEFFTVLSVIPPPQTLGRPSTARSTETENEESLLTTPLFWIAVVGWFLVVPLLIVVIILAK